MDRIYLKRFLMLFCAMLLVGWSAGPGASQTAVDLDNKVISGQYVNKIENFIVILDASDTMNGVYKGKSKLAGAQDTLKRFNQTIPSIKINGALRKFADVANYNEFKQTELVYGMILYTRSGFGDGLASIKSAQGGSPLAAAIHAASNDLSSAQGNSAVIIVTDAALIPYDPVISAAQSMKDKYGDRVCIYTILVGDDSRGRILLDKVARPGGCGFSTDADSLASESSMVDFITKVFLAKKKMAPPPPPPPAPKPKAMPGDSDRDGVYDDVDKCPDTPMGAPVNMDGCWVIDHVYFDTDKWNIKSKSYAQLDEVVKVLRRNPMMDLKIEGHTDSRGSMAYNQALSEKRAAAVMNYLTNKGIDPNRLMMKGYSFARPAAPNTSLDSMSLNRRTELIPVR